MKATHTLGALTLICALSMFVGLIGAMWHADRWVQVSFGVGIIGSICFGVAFAFSWMEEGNR